MFAPPQLTVQKVFSTLKEIAVMSGHSVSFKCLYFTHLTLALQVYPVTLNSPANLSSGKGRGKHLKSTCITYIFYKHRYVH